MVFVSGVRMDIVMGGVVGLICVCILVYGIKVSRVVIYGWIFSVFMVFFDSLWFFEIVGLCCLLNFVVN